MPDHNFYKGGQWNVICDICGFVFKSDQIETDWEGSKRCRPCIDGRHPQDFVRAIKDDPSVPFSRPWIPSIDTGVWINNSLAIIAWTGNGGNVLSWIHS